MLWINFKRILRSGFISFWRNGVVSLSAVLVMSITLLIIALTIFSSAILDYTLNSLENQVDINVYLTPRTLESDIISLKNQIESLPEVEKVEYVTEEAAQARYKERHSDKQQLLDALDELPENPLGAELNIKAKEPSQYENVQLFLQQNYLEDPSNVIIENVNYKDNQLAIERLSLIIKAGERFGLIINILFVILSIIITLNTIRLSMFISRDEIKVMNLVGADKTYISGPFVVTGAIYGIVSSILVLILLYPITFYVKPTISEAFLGLDLFKYYITNFGQMFLVIFFSGILIGAISSFLAVNRYLKNR